MPKLTQSQTAMLEQIRDEPDSFKRVGAPNTRHSLIMLGLIVGADPSFPDRSPYKLTPAGVEAVAGRPWMRARFVHYVIDHDAASGLAFEPSFNRRRVENRAAAIGARHWIMSMVEPFFRARYPGVEPVVEGDAKCPTCGDLYDAEGKQYECPRCRL